MKQRQPQSSNRAEHKMTGEVLAASEILTHPPHPTLGRRYGHEDYKLWQCCNCKVQVFPRAWNDKREWEKTPYFTAHPGKHERDCKPEFRDRTPSAQGRDPRTPTELVSHLILTSMQRGLTIVRPPVLSGELSISPDYSADDHHSRSERHIASACGDFISGRPGVLDAPLRIDRSPSQPYRHWFVRLGTGGPEILWTTRIFFGELRFTALRDIDWDGGGAVCIPLHSFVDGRPRRIFIHAENWAEPLVAEFRKRLTEVMRIGRAVWQRQPDRPYVFFLAEEVDMRQADYHVHSEACVYAKLCTVPDLGRASRRYQPPSPARGDVAIKGECPNKQEPQSEQEVPVSEPASDSESALPQTVTAFTPDTRSVDGKTHSIAESFITLPIAREDLPGMAASANGSAPVVVEEHRVWIAPTSEPSATPSAPPGAQKPSTRRPLHLIAQPSIPSYVLRVVARFAKAFRVKASPMPTSASPGVGRDGQQADDQ